MRWTTKTKTVKAKAKAKAKAKHKSYPKVGDEKIETKFAWFPTSISSNDNVWLEKYELVYEYEQRRRPIYVKKRKRCSYMNLIELLKY